MHLADREFLLLRHLMRHQGEVCGRAELLAGGLGLVVRSRHQCRGRLRRQAAREARKLGDPDGPECRLLRSGRLAGSKSSGPVRCGERGHDVLRQVVGGDPLPLRVAQHDAALRLPHMEREQTDAAGRRWSCSSPGVAIGRAVIQGGEGLDELAEVPLLAGIFIAMAWHARRRQTALAELRHTTQERDFIRDASHQLRTPITVARGHAELILEAHPHSPRRRRREGDCGRAGAPVDDLRPPVDAGGGRAAWLRGLPAGRHARASSSGHGRALAAGRRTAVARARDTAAASR